MGLDPSTENYRARLVVVKPVYGWGWSRLDAPEIPVPAQINGVPYSFHSRIQYFFSFEGELRGAVATIVEPGHVFNGMPMVFSTRLAGLYDFTDHLPYCDIQIGGESPTGDWPEFVGGSPIINGYGFVGESLLHIEENDARMADKNNKTV